MPTDRMHIKGIDRSHAAFVVLLLNIQTGAFYAYWHWQHERSWLQVFLGQVVGGKVVPTANFAIIYALSSLDDQRPVSLLFSYREGLPRVGRDTRPIGLESPPISALNQLLALRDFGHQRKRIALVEGFVRASDV